MYPVGLANLCRDNEEKHWAADSLEPRMQFAIFSTFNCISEIIKGKFYNRYHRETSEADYWQQDSFYWSAVNVSNQQNYLIISENFFKFGSSARHDLRASCFEFLRSKGQRLRSLCCLRARSSRVCASIDSLRVIFLKLWHLMSQKVRG